MAGLLDGLLADLHLLGEELRQPLIPGKLVRNKGYGKASRHLYGGLALLAVVEPGLRPAPVTVRVEIEGGLPLHVIRLCFYLKIGKGIYYIISGRNLISKFFFCCSPQVGI